MTTKIQNKVQRKTPAMEINKKCIPSETTQEKENHKINSNKSGNQTQMSEAPPKGKKEKTN